jgi:flagellar hook protein FlgE
MMVSIQDVETSNVDLAEELSIRYQASQATRPTSKPFRVDDEMVGTLLDTIG